MVYFLIYLFKDNLLPYLSPSLMVCHTHRALRDDPAAMLQTAQDLCEFDFYRRVEMLHLDDEKSLKEILNTYRNAGVSTTMWLTMVLIENGYNLCDLDEKNRLRSSQAMISWIEKTGNLGLDRIAVLSGNDPKDKSLRPRALEQLAKSIDEIYRAKETYPEMELILEPLDRDSHKNHLLGPTRDVVPFMNEMRRGREKFGMCWDSSHIALCEDNLEASLKACAPHVFQIHLANAILDRKHPLYGDHHLPPGDPGYLTDESLPRLYQCIEDNSENFPLEDITVAIEIGNNEERDPWSVETQCRQHLEKHFSSTAGV